MPAHSGRRIRVSSELLMGNLNLVEAFATFGGKPTSRLHSVSAISSDGTELILACSAARFAHPSRGVLRYEDKLTRDAERPAETQMLGEHLTRARDGNLPVRMIVVTETTDANGKVSRAIHVRPDLVGKIVNFDGDQFSVDFVRSVETALAGARMR
jgi:hypothetical protein